MYAISEFIRINVLVCLPAYVFSTDVVDIPMLDTLNAPLKATLDISVLNKEIKEIIQEEVKREIQMLLTEKAHGGNDTNGTFITWEFQNRKYDTSIKTLTERLDTLEKNRNGHQDGILDNINERVSRMVGFHAQLTTDLTLGTRQTVIFDNAITNIGDAYSPNTGNFIAPYNGVYYFVCSFLKRGHGPQLHLQMIKNTNEISRGHSAPGGSETGTMSALVLLKKGDRIKVLHFPSSSNSEIIHGEWSYFTGYLIK